MPGLWEPCAAVPGTCWAGSCKALAQFLKGGGEESSSQDAEMKNLKLSAEPGKVEVGQGSGPGGQGPAH